MSHSRPRGSGRSGERGAALLQMSIAMLAITAFSTFVMDYGVFWVARRQAQNAADAGALAGAIAVAFGEDASPGGASVLGAQATARANVVWGVPPSVVVGGLNGTTDVAVEACPDRPAHQCVRTDVYRTTGRGNPLPTYFGRLAAIDTQDVQATATAEVREANESNCVQHWGIADHWQDDKVDWWNTASTPMWDAGVDVYTPPNESAPGTGLRVVNGAGEFCCDYGQRLILQNLDRRLARFYGRLDFGGGGCVSGDLDDPPNRLRRFLNPSTIAAINGLVDADPDACWSGDPGCGQNLDTRCPHGCVYSPLHGVNASPRIVVVRSYDPGQVADIGGTSPNSAQVNLVALFIEESHRSARGTCRSVSIVAPAAYNPSEPIVDGGSVVPADGRARALRKTHWPGPSPSSARRIGVSRTPCARRASASDRCRSPTFWPSRSRNRRSPTWWCSTSATTMCCRQRWRHCGGSIPRLAWSSSPRAWTPS